MTETVWWKEAQIPPFGRGTVLRAHELADCNCEKTCVARTGVSPLVRDTRGPAAERTCAAPVVPVQKSLWSQHWLQNLMHDLSQFQGQRNLLYG
jgi:hypothetical protein